MHQLDEIIEAFQFVEPEMRLELLLDYADQLPPLGSAYKPLRDKGLHMIHECQSPVFLKVEVINGCVRLFADVPREAPTARGFVSIMLKSFDGTAPNVVAAAPRDILNQLGLSNLIGIQRTRGLNAIYFHIKNEVKRQISNR